MIARLFVGSIVTTALLTASSARADDRETLVDGRPSLIPRSVLFGNPDHASVQISHDGKHLCWLAPVDGVINVWVAAADKLDAAKPLTHDTKRGIRQYFWA